MTPRRVRTAAACLALLPAFAASASLAWRVGPFTRQRTDDTRTLLETAVQEWGRTDGAGPRVVLVSAVHIGDPTYYAAVQSELDSCDLVLFESVMPAGARGGWGDTPEARIASTRAALSFLAAQCARALADGADPSSIDELAAAASREDGRMGAVVRRAARDAWGRPLELVRDGASVRLRSLGRDGAPGGEDEDADLHAIAAEPPTEGESPVSAVQIELARTLRLAFQLDAIDYDRPHFHASDMSEDQLLAAMSARGLEAADPAELVGAGELPIRLMRLLLGFVRLVDRVADGAASDAAKLLLVELLGDEDLVMDAMAQQGPELVEVLIADRNAIVMEDLRAVLADAPPERIAIFYGAGHMADFGRRLHEELGMRALETRWIPAISIEAPDRATAASHARMRAMLRRSMPSAR